MSEFFVQHTASGFVVDYYNVWCAIHIAVDDPSHLEYIPSSVAVTAVCMYTRCSQFRSILLQEIRVCNKLSISSSVLVFHTLPPGLIWSVAGLNGHTAGCQVYT
jgi:hypothetical protein